MTDVERSQRILLRAEITRAGRTVVAHTIDISESSAFVQTNETASNGDQVYLRLSFPGLVEAIEFETHVASTRKANGPGRVGGWKLAFVFPREGDREKLRALLARENPADSATNDDSDAIPYRVILVEDSELTRDVFSYRVEKYFKGRNSRVTMDLAQDAEEAWDMLERAPYDLAIVDYMLPTDNGDHLISRLRKARSSDNVPIVAISVAGEEARQATLAAGADFFLEKPVSVEDLFSTLDRLTMSSEKR